MRHNVTYSLDLDEKDTAILASFKERYEGLIYKLSTPDSCWIWTGMVSRLGYGRFSVQIDFRKKTFFAHRIMFFLHNPQAPLETVVRHRCDNPRCVNPKHLIGGTHADNVADRVKRGRSARGEQSGRSKLTTEKVINIKKSLQLGAYVKNLAKQYGVDPKAIRLIRDGINWKHIQVQGRSQCRCNSSANT